MALTGDELNQNKPDPMYDEMPFDEDDDEDDDEDVSRPKRRKTNIKELLTIMEEQTKMQIQAQPMTQLNFSVSDFRHNLAEPRTVLQAMSNFLRACKDDCLKGETVVSLYFKHGGTADEVASLLPETRIEGHDLTTLPALTILMKLLSYTVQKNITDVTAPVCKRIIGCPKINDFLYAEPTQTRVILLKLLAAVACHGVRYAKDVLEVFHVDEVASVLVRGDNSDEMKELQEAFIEFNMAYLKSGNSYVLNQLCGKKDILMCVIRGLMFDNKALVSLYLQTLRTKIVENVGILKTAKMNIFNTKAMKTLIELFYWKGPKSITEQDHRTDKIVVQKVLYTLLTSLCTSFKFGIVFRDESLGSIGKSRNDLLKSIVELVKYPLAHNIHADLLKQIFVTCPDVFITYLNKQESMIEPTETLQWLKTIEFFFKILSDINLETWLRSEDKVTRQLVAHAVTNIIIPTPVLRALKPQASLLSLSYPLRNQVILLLVLMLEKYRSFMLFIRNKLNTEDYKSVAEQLRNYIYSNFPSSVDVIEAWKDFMTDYKNDNLDSTSTDSGLPIPDHKAYLTKLLDLLILYDKCCPALIEVGLFKPSKLVKDLQEVLCSPTETLTDPNIVKAFHFMVSADKDAFKPPHTAFKYTFNTLLQIVSANTGGNRKLAKSALYTLLLESGIFEGNSLEAAFWVYGFTFVPEDKREIVCDLFTAAVVKASKHPVKYLDMVSEAYAKCTDNECGNMEGYAAHVFDDLIGAFESGLLVTNSMASMTAYASIGPLLPAFFSVVDEHFPQKDKPKAVRDFLSRVVVFLMHTQKSAEMMYHLVSSSSHLLRSSAMDYILGWLPQNQPVPLRRPFGDTTLEHNLSLYILQSQPDACKDVFGVDCVQWIKISDKIDAFEVRVHVQEDHYKINESDDVIRTLHLHFMTLFHMCRLIGRNELTEISGENCVSVMSHMTYLLYQVSRDHMHDDHDLVTKLYVTCFAKAFAHPTLVRGFSPFYKDSNVSETCVTEFIRDMSRLLLQFAKGQDILVESLTTPYKQKLINTIISKIRRSIAKDKPPKRLHSLIDFVASFRCTMPDVVHLLRNLVSLYSTTFWLTGGAENEAGFFPFSTYGVLVCDLLKYSTTVHQVCGCEKDPIPDDIIATIMDVLTVYERTTNVEYTFLEESLLEYFKVYPHQLEHISNALITSIMMRPDYQAHTMKFFIFIVKRSIEKALFAKELLMQNSDMKSNSALVFPLIDTFLGFPIVLEESLLNDLFALHVDNIKQAIISPADAPVLMKQYHHVTTWLMDKNGNNFEEQYTAVVQDIENYNRYESFHLKLLNKVFTQAKWMAYGGDEAVVNFIQICIQMLHNCVTDENRDHQNYAGLVQTVADWTTNDVVMSKWRRVKKSNAWVHFSTLALKHGIDSSNRHPLLLTALLNLCKLMYKDGADEGFTEDLFDKMMSHSQFLNVMFGTATCTKENLIQLMTVLLVKNPRTMRTHHIPILLGAYNASLSAIDQKILKLLHHYHSFNVNTHNVRPYLWGRAAIVHYSVHSGHNLSLWRQPTSADIMGNINSVMVENTLKEFPIDRSMDASGIEPHPYIDDVYDPAFILPLFASITSTESFIKPTVFHQSGCLALSIAATGSKCSAARLGAYHILYKFYEQMRSSEKKGDTALWMHFMSALGRGAKALNPHGHDAELTAIVSLFLARTSLRISDVADPLYDTLVNYISVKEIMDLTNVPEFYVMFHNSGIYSDVHRKFMLEVLRDGMQTVKDFVLCHQRYVYKMILSYFNSPLADYKSKVMILEFLERSTKMKDACGTFIQSYSLIPWIIKVIQTTDESQVDVFTSCLHLTMSLWENVKMEMVDRLDEGVIARLKTTISLILNILITYMNKLTRKITLTDFDRLIHTLDSIIQRQMDINSLPLIDLADIKSLLQVGERVIGDVTLCKDLLRFGYKFAEIDLVYTCGTPEPEFVLNSLRWLVVKWLQLTKQESVTL